MQIVAKKWIGGNVLERNFWDTEIKTHQKAKELLDEWNKLKLINKVQVTEIPIKVVTRHFNDNESNINIKNGEWLLIEKQLKGEFTKWNSNNGYVNLSQTSVQAFCHWT